MNHQTENNFWPRIEAYKIMCLESRSQMLEALDNTPPEFKEWIRDIINTWINRAGSLEKAKRLLLIEKMKSEGKY